MARYKRGYPRSTASGAHVSQITYRKHHGILPLRPKKFDDFLCGAPYGSAAYFEARLRYYEHRDWPDEFNMMANWPRWWDVLYHTRPARRKAKALMLKIRIGRIDPDDTMFPDYRKPLKFYW